VTDRRTPRDEGNDPDVIADRLLPSLVTCGCLVPAGATLLGQAAAFAFGRFVSGCC
jgi:hypothetical protein